MSTPFPLPVETFESYMLAEDRPAYPRNVLFRLDFSGVLDRMIFEAALAAAVARHPLLQANLAVVDGRRVWQSGSTPPILDWDDSTAPLLSASPQIDVTRRAGLRLWVRQGSGAAQLTLEAHHACCDGVGALMFIGDLLSAYDQLVRGRPIELSALDPTRLTTRGKFGVKPRGFGQAIRETAHGLRDGLRLTLRRLAPFATASDRGRLSAPNFLDFQSQRLSGEESQQLKAAAKASRVQLNDLLLRDLFCTLAEWNAQHGDRRNRWLRINVPTNLRSREDVPMPAANMMSFTFIDRRAAECRDEQRQADLLQGLHEETEAIKRDRLGLYFIGEMALLQSLPGAVQLALADRRCLATAVLSNVGDCTRAFRSVLSREGSRLRVGDVLLDDIRGVPPLRSLTRVGITVGWYAAQFNICMRCDPWWFTAEDSQEVLAAYMRQIRRTLAAAPVSKQLVAAAP